MNRPEQAFWRHTPLAAMSEEQWEKICDGCALCCLVKLEDEDNGDIYYTNIACRQLDLHSCRCKNYEQRLQLASECVKLDHNNLAALQWLPPGCSYRQLHESGQLPEWHPLLTGSDKAMQELGISACSFAISESELSDEVDYEDHIIAALE